MKRRRARGKYVKPDPPTQNNAELNRALQQIYAEGGRTEEFILPRPVPLHLMFQRGRNIDGLPSSKTVEGYVKAELIGSPRPDAGLGSKRLLTIRFEDGFETALSVWHLMSVLSQHAISADKRGGA